VAPAGGTDSYKRAKKQGDPGSAMDQLWIWASLQGNSNCDLSPGSQWAPWLPGLSATPGDID